MLKYIVNQFYGTDFFSIPRRELSGYHNPGNDIKTRIVEPS
jgi:hypothetical protein